jgi:16S rRNA (guanine1516-N2)-methyltransferase
MMLNPVPLVLAEGACAGAAERLGAELGSPILTEADWRLADPPLALWFDDEGLALRGSPSSRAHPVRPEAPELRRGQDPLLRVLGRSGTVIDATGGFLADAAVMAAAGWQVTVIERHPVMAAIAREAIGRWRAAGNPAANRLELLEGDAKALLLERRADVVYLDPMYPPQRGRAASRKGEPLHLLSLLLGDDPDQASLLGPAQRAAQRRVVVKRPLAASELGPTPSGSQRGRTVRYDIYPPQEVPA